MLEGESASAVQETVALLVETESGAAPATGKERVEVEAGATAA
jgi:hypothetical protein